MWEKLMKHIRIDDTCLCLRDNSTSRSPSEYLDCVKLMIFDLETLDRNITEFAMKDWVSGEWFNDEGFWSWENKKGDKIQPKRKTYVHVEPNLRTKKAKDWTGNGITYEGKKDQTTFRELK